MKIENGEVCFLCAKCKVTWETFFNGVCPKCKQSSFFTRKRNFIPHVVLVKNNVEFIEF